MSVHQSVGSSTHEITPSSSILLSSLLTTSNNEIATLRGVVKAKGFALSFNLMVYSHVSFPSPLNNLLNSLSGLLFV